MRVLFTTTGGAGHVGPLLPFARALRAAGHEILVAVRRTNAATVIAAGLPARDVDDAPPEPRAAVFAQVWGLSTDRANALVVGEIFAGLDAPAALPGIQAAIEDWRPDVLVHESCEFAGPLAAEQAGVPSCTSPIALVSSDELLGPSAGPAVARMRAQLGLPVGPPPGWHESRPVLTLTPPSLEDPAAPGPAHIRRFRDDEAPAARAAGLVGRAGGAARLSDLRIRRPHDAVLPGPLPRRDRRACGPACAGARDHRAYAGPGRAGAAAAQRPRRALGPAGGHRAARRGDRRPRRLRHRAGRDLGGHPAGRLSRSSPISRTTRAASPRWARASRSRTAPRRSAGSAPRSSACSATRATRRPRPAWRRRRARCPRPPRRST